MQEQIIKKLQFNFLNPTPLKIYSFFIDHHFLNKHTIPTIPYFYSFEKHIHKY